MTHSPLAVLAVNALFSVSSAVPVAVGTVCAASLVLFRRSLFEYRPFGPRESESIMNFSKNGTLRCVCGAEHSTQDFQDRRQFCRSCGCEVVEQDVSRLSQQFSSGEIRLMTRSLRRAAIRASHLELPPSITTVEELHEYLKSEEPKNPRTPPTQSTPIEIPQIH